MATIRKRNDRWHVQIRRKGTPSLTRSFARKDDAARWARETETSIDQSRLPPDPKSLNTISLGVLVKRYRDTVTPRKRRAITEQIELNAFLRHPICTKLLSEVSTADFAAYRDERLARVKPTTVKRQLGPIRHLFRIAQDEWGLPIHHNPLDKLRLHALDQRRDRRLKTGELKKLLTAAKQGRTRAAAFPAFDPEKIELPGDVAEDECAVAGHRASHAKRPGRRKRSSVLRHIAATGFRGRGAQERYDEEIGGNFRSAIAAGAKPAAFLSYASGARPNQARAAIGKNSAISIKRTR